MSTLGTIRLTKVRLHVTRYGIPHVAFDTSEETALPIGMATLSVGDLAARCTVFESFRRRGVTSARAVGGAGGWRKTAPPDGGKRNDAGVKLSTVATTLAGVVGETVRLLPGVDRALGSPVARFGATARHALTALCASPSGSRPVPWYVDMTGGTVLGERAGVPVTLAVLDGEVGPVYAYSGDAGLLSLLPGNTIEGRTIEVLRVFADADKIRAEAIVTP